MQTLLDEGGTWIVDADLESYFDTIPKDRLMSRVKERIADSRVLALIRSYLDQGVMEELTLHEPTERGTPQGAVISPLLANIYLDPFDHLLAACGVFCWPAECATPTTSCCCVEARKKRKPPWPECKHGSWKTV